MIRFLLSSAALLVGFAVLGADDSADKSKQEKPSAAQQKFDKLRAEYRDAYARYSKARADAGADEEKIKKANEKLPDPARFAPGFLDLAKKYPNDHVAVDALIWVGAQATAEKEGKEALELLVKKHLDDPKIAQLCRGLGYMEKPAGAAFLETVLEKCKSRDARGQACYALAAQTLQRAELARENKNADADKLATRAEALFERVATDFADVKTNDTPLGDDARADLYELRHLQIGMVAPEIEGEDIDGAKMKLSDFRGKVVLLDFWGNW